MTNAKITVTNEKITIKIVYVRSVWCDFTNVDTFCDTSEHAINMYYLTKHICYLVMLTDHVHRDMPEIHGKHMVDVDHTEKAYK